MKVYKIFASREPLKDRSTFYVEANNVPNLQQIRSVCDQHVRLLIQDAVVCEPPLAALEQKYIIANMFNGGLLIAQELSPIRIDN